MRTCFSRILPVFLFSLAALQVQAQASQVVTLDQAIEMSLKASSQLKVDRARIEEAAAAVQEATDRRLPDVTATGSYMRLNTPVVNMKAKQAGADTASGGSAGISQAAYGLVNASLPLYAGSRIKWGIESAKYLQKAAVLDAENDRDAVVINTIDAFNNLAKAKAQVALVRQSLAQAQVRVKEFSNLEKNGLLARNDLLKAQLQASNLELSLLDAENNWKLSNINMNLLLGLPQSTDLLPDSASLQPAGVLVSAEDLMDEAVKNRKDIAALEYRKKAAGAGVRATLGEKYPSIALTGGYIAADVPNLFTLYNAVNVGVGVNYSLSSLWKTNAKVAQAKAREKAIVAGQSQLQDAVKLEVGKAYLTYTSSLKKIEVYALSVQQAEEAYRITNNKFNNSLSTTTELLEAEVAQLQARLNYSFAKNDAAVAYRHLLQAAGIMEYAGK